MQILIYHFQNYTQNCRKPLFLEAQILRRIRPKIFNPKSLPSTNGPYPPNGFMYYFILWRGVVWSNGQHRRLPLQGLAVQIPVVPFSFFVEGMLWVSLVARYNTKRRSPSMLISFKILLSNILSACIASRVFCWI